MNEEAKLTNEGPMLRKMGAQMKSAPMPVLTGSTPWERLDNAFRRVLTVPKEALLKEETKVKRARAKKKRTRKRA